MGFRAAATCGAAAEADREIVDLERSQLFMLPEQGRISCATLFLERFADGSANMVFEMPRPTAARRADEEVAIERDTFRYSADLDRVVLNAPIDAPTFFVIDRGLQMIKGF